MLRATLLGTAVFLMLTGCANIGISFNPVNWFSSSIIAQLDTNGQPPTLIPSNRRTAVIDNRTLVQSIISLNVDPTSTGAIISAVGVAQTKGYFNAELVSNNITNGVLELEFRVQTPTPLAVPGTIQSRKISAAYFINRIDLLNISSVRVTAETNARTSTR